MYNIGKHTKDKIKEGAKMSLTTICAICGIITCATGVLSFFMGQKNGLSKNSYEQGVKDTRTESELKTINQKIESELKGINQKIDTELKGLNEKLGDFIENTVKREEFATLSQKVENLEKTVYRNQSQK